MILKIKVGHEASNVDFHLIPGQNLYTGSKNLEEACGALNSLEEDMLNLACGIYAADLAVKRKEREQFIRTMELDIDVVNYHAFQRIKDKLKLALYILSKDNWLINFKQKPGSPISVFEWENKEGAVLLFSGGLDSMCAASEFIKVKGDITLVSHITHGNDDVCKSQINVRQLLERYYKTKLRHIQVKVYGRNKGKHRFPTDQERENTQRTRSFLFLTLGAIITRRCGYSKVLFMAENGQFAIHLPLNHSRVGPFSTHTADPEFLEIAQEIFRTISDNHNFEIINPFLYRTKAEVFALLPDELKRQSNQSITCWMISRTKKHCGECIPCISRRLAIEYNGLKVDVYKENIFSANIDDLPDDSVGKRNLTDYLEFISKFTNMTPVKKQDLLLEFPELFNKAVDQEMALEMFKRLAEQSFQVFNSYPNVTKLI